MEGRRTPDGSPDRDLGVHLNLEAWRPPHLGTLCAGHLWTGDNLAYGATR